MTLDFDSIYVARKATIKPKRRKITNNRPLVDYWLAKYGDGILCCNMTREGRHIKNYCQN